MEEMEFNELIAICKHVAIRFKRISKKDKEYMVYHILFYLKKCIEYYKNNGKTLSRKHLIYIGNNYVRPKGPFEIGCKIKFN